MNGRHQHVSSTTISLSEFQSFIFLINKLMFPFSFCNTQDFKSVQSLLVRIHSNCSSNQPNPFKPAIRHIYDTINAAFLRCSMYTVNVTAVISIGRNLIFLTLFYCVWWNLWSMCSFPSIFVISTNVYFILRNIKKLCKDTLIFLDIEGEPTFYRHFGHRYARLSRTPVLRFCRTDEAEM